MPTRSGGRRLALLFLSCMSFAGSSPAFSATEESAAAGPLSLEAWRELQDAADEASTAPQLPERIARCEAFLKAHPDYPEITRVAGALARAYLESGSYDTRRVTDLLELLARNTDPRFPEGPAWIAQNYYVKHKLPLDSARRLLQMSRDRIARERRGLQSESDATRREQDERKLGGSEARVLGIEGELLLASGEAAGALKKLQEAAKTAMAYGQDILAVDAGGGIVRSFPSNSLEFALVDANLAAAWAKAGHADAAREVLGRITDFFDYPQRDAVVGPLRESLGMAPPAGVEIRGEALRASGFALDDLQKRKVRLGDYRGRVVILNFWSTT